MPTMNLEPTVTAPVAISTTSTPDLGLIPPPPVSAIAVVGGASLAAFVIAAVAIARATTWLIRSGGAR